MTDWPDTDAFGSREKVFLKKSLKSSKRNNCLHVFETPDSQLLFKTNTKLVITTQTTYQEYDKVLIGKPEFANCLRPKFPHTKSRAKVRQTT